MVTVATVNRNRVEPKMAWAAVITAILDILGPVLLDALKKWLSGLFTKTAKSLGDPPAGGGHAELLQAALDATPRVRVFKRAFLRHAAAVVPAAIAAGKLAPADKKELATLAAHAAAE